MTWLKNQKLKDRDIFSEIIENVINNNFQYSLRKEHFVQLFTNYKVKDELIKFENAEKQIDQKVVVEEFRKIIYDDQVDAENIAEIIIRDLINEINYKIFEDPIYSKRFFHSFLQIIKNNQTEYSEKILIELKNIQAELMGIRFDNIHTHQKIDEIKDILLKDSKLIPQSNNDKLNERIRIANDLMGDGKVVAARKYYKELLNEVDKDETDIIWKLNSNIGKSYLNDYDSENAHTYFFKAYEVYPNEEKGLIQLVLSCFVRNNYEEGIEITDRILKLHPSSINAKILKSNFLVYLEKYKEAIGVFEKQDHNSFEICHALGFALGKAKQYSAAIKILKKALKYERSPIVLDLLAVNILEPLIDKLQNIRPIRIDINSKNYKKLCEALDYLNESIELWDKQEIKKQLAIAFMNRGIIYSLIKDKIKCLEDYKRSEQLGLFSANLYRNLGICYIELGAYKDATKYFYKAIDAGDSKARELLMNSLILEGNYTTLKEVVLQFIKGDLSDLSESNVYFYSVLSEVYERELDFESSQKILGELKQNYLNDIRVIERIVESLRSKGEINEAIIFLKEKTKKIRNRDIVKLILADLYFELRDYAKSSKLYSELISLFKYEQIERRYLYSLINSGNYIDTIKCIDAFEKNIGTDYEELNKIRAEITFYFENFEESKEIYKKLATNYKKTEYYIRWGLSVFRLGDLSAAEKILNTCENELPENPVELIKISSAYSIIGKTTKALELAYELVKKNPDEINVNKNFMFIFIEHTQQHPQLKIDNSKAKLFSELLGSFDLKFPGDGTFFKISVNESFDELKSLLHDQEKYYKQINQFYDFHRAPLSFISKILKRDIYTTWASFLKDVNRKIWAYPYVIPKKEIIIAKSYRKKYVLDPTSFFTCFSIMKMDLLKYFDDFIVPQRLLDVLTFEVNNLKMSLKDGIKRVYSLNGQLCLNEISPIEVESNIKALNEMISLLKGRTFGYEINSESFSKDKILSLLDEATLQAIIYSLSKKIPMILDDYSLREYLSVKFDGKVISSLTFLNAIKLNNKISQSEYYSMILKLISANYYFISLNSEIILYSLKNDNFDFSATSPFILKYLNQPDVDEESVANVLSELFIALYSESISEIKRDAWLDYALTCLPRNNLNTTFLLKIIYERVINKSTSIIQYDSVIKWLDVRLHTWAIAHAVPYFK